LNLAIHRAEQAVARTLEEKKQLKERKKAEAAERKRLHDLAVAQRKASDISYLGRGVSKGLSYSAGTAKFFMPRRCANTSKSRAPRLSVSVIRSQPLRTSAAFFARGFSDASTAFKTSSRIRSASSSRVDILRATTSSKLNLSASVSIFKDRMVRKV